jgi:hypothetical protein
VAAYTELRAGTKLANLHKSLSGHTPPLTPNLVMGSAFVVCYMFFKQLPKLFEYKFQSISKTIIIQHQLVPICNQRGK